MFEGTFPLEIEDAYYNIIFIEGLDCVILSFEPYSTDMLCIPADKEFCKNAMAYRDDIGEFTFSEIFEEHQSTLVDLYSVSFSDGNPNQFRKMVIYKRREPLSPDWEEYNEEEDLHDFYKKVANLIESNEHVSITSYDKERSTIKIYTTPLIFNDNGKLYMLGKYLIFMELSSPYDEPEIQIFDSTYNFNSSRYAHPYAFTNGRVYYGEVVGSVVRCNDFVGIAQEVIDYLCGEARVPSRSTWNVPIEEFSLIGDN